MLLDALFRSEPLENPSVPVTGEAAETDNIFARDVYVSPETSMKLAAVYACIYVISSSVAQMPLHVMRKTNEHVQPARDHPLFWLVHDEPNAWQTSYKWRELKQRHVLEMCIRDSLQRKATRKNYWFSEDSSGITTLSH